jgi:transposase-like protein
MDKHDIFSNLTTGLENILKEGARRLLQQAIENEIQEVIDSYKDQKNCNNQRVVKRNGYLPSREIQTGLGNMTVAQPRIRGISFTSAILPKYMRRLPSLEALIPALYLKGISTGDMQEALEAILGENAKGLSATNVVRHKESWEEEYSDWNKKNFIGKR